MTPTDPTPWWVPAKAGTSTLSLSPKRAVSLAGANWKVSKEELYAYQSLSGGWIGPSEDHFGLVRADTQELLAIVGGRSPLVQNLATARWAEEVAEYVDGFLEGSWLLREGRAFGLTVASIEALTTVSVRGALARPVLHLLNWHGEGALEAHLTFAVEDHGASVIELPSGPAFHARNTGNVEKLGTWTQERAALFCKNAEALGGKPAPLRTLQSVYGSVWPKPADGAGPKSVARWHNRLEDIRAVWEEVGGPEYGAWGIALAFNTWAQYHRPFRGTAGDPDLQEELRGEEILFGQTREIGEAVWKQLTKGKR